MGKQDQYMQGYGEGLLKGLRIAREGGIESLEKEVKFRGITGINTKVSQMELLKASEQIKELTLKTVLTLAVMVLRDEFGFGSARGDRFVRRFNEKAACLAEDFVSWKDMIETINEEMGIDISFSEKEARRLEKYESKQ